MNRLKFDDAVRLAEADWHFEKRRLQRLLHQYAERSGFVHQFDQLSQNSSPDVVRTDRDRRPRKVFVGNVSPTEQGTPVTTLRIDEIHGHLRDFGCCVRWGTGGFFAIATNSLGAALKWSPVLNTLSEMEGLTDADGGQPNFRIKNLGQRAWIVVW